MIKIFYKISILFLFIAVLSPAYVFAEGKKLSNTGFVSQNIWYSEQKFFAGDNILIHAVIKSSGEYDFLGIVKFYDDKKLLDSTKFYIKKGEYVGDAKIKWVATVGYHNISAQILNSKIIINGEEVSILVTDSESISSKSFVDLDTDGDGIGNKEDLDDDGDGVSDVEELKLGTDPLKKDVKKTKTENIALKKLPNSDNVPLSSRIEDVKKVANGSVLPVVKSVARKVFDATEIARKKQGEFSNKKILKVKKEILKEKKDNKPKKDGFDARTPFNYTSLLALTFLSYTSKYLFLYYGLIGLAILYFVVILWRRWRR